MPKLVPNFIADEGRDSAASPLRDARNPATAEGISRMPLSAPDEVDVAVREAAQAFPDSRRTLVLDRLQLRFKLKDKLEAHFEERARLVTLEFV